MQNELKKLLEVIAEDYARWDARSPYGDEDRKAERQAEFAEGLSIEEGRKYAKIVMKNGSQQTVWGFVVKGADKKFQQGDILKAAGWSAPARNKPRGNILEGDFSRVRWTGPEYL